MKTDTIEIADLVIALREAAAIRHGGPVPIPTIGPPPGIVRAAVQQAVALRRLAQSAERMGFLALPLDRYLARLAQRAGVSLEGLLPPVRTSESGGRLWPWLALAKRLSFESYHLQLWVRAWFALECRLPAPELSDSAVMARGGAAEPPIRYLRPPLSVPETASPANADAELQRLEGSYSSSQCQALDRYLRQLD